VLLSFLVIGHFSLEDLDEKSNQAARLHHPPRHLGTSAAAWPLAARAQQPKLPVIGYLHSGVRNDGNGQIAAFHRGLREAGFIEGQNVAVEYRFAENRDERAQTLAAELVQQQVALIVAAPNQRAIGAAKAATTTIPIVFMSGPDPVRRGLVASLNRPGGNLTGVTQLSGDLTAKRLGLLHDLAGC
jgi:putative ABC transport system substrate-binding protein